jgi:hypothetical protein
MDLSIRGIGVLVEVEAFRVANFVVNNYMYDEFEAAIRGLSESDVNELFLLL